MFVTQTVHFRLVGGIRPDSNRLPHYFGVNYNNGGNESRSYYMFGMINLTSEIDLAGALDVACERIQTSAHAQLVVGV